jgi:hypothetical protein
MLPVKSPILTMDAGQPRRIERYHQVCSIAFSGDGILENRRTRRWSTSTSWPATPQITRAAAASHTTAPFSIRVRVADQMRDAKLIGRDDDAVVLNTRD